MFIPTALRFLSASGTRAAAVATVALSALAVVSPARAETVSKLPGADGLPFAAQFIDASSDGRYVLLSVGVWDQSPPATGPEADVDALGMYVLRDRVADTTTKLTYHLIPGGSNLAAYPKQISDDGNRILIAGGDSDLSDFAGWGSAVYDRSQDRVLKLPSLPTGVRPDSATLSADGKSAVIASNFQAGTYRNTWWRGPVSGNSSSALDLAGGYVAGISGDLNTIVYNRPLARASRPAFEPGATDSVGLSRIGVKVGDQAPRVLYDSEYVETAPAAGTACTSASVGIRSSIVGAALVAADGARVGWTLHVLTPTGEEKSLDSRWADGTRTSKPYTGRYYYPFVDAFGSTNEVLYDAEFTEGYDARLELVAGDTELVGSATALQYISPGAHATRYTEAKPFSGTPAAAPRPFVLGNEPVDNPDDVSRPTWYTCPAAAAGAPVGKFSDYAKVIAIANPAALHSIGSVAVDLTPSSELRAATAATVELSVFGIPYWTKTVTKSAYLELPKPIFGIPIVLKTTVRPAAAPGQAKPAPLVNTRSIWSNRYN